MVPKTRFFRQGDLPLVGKEEVMTEALLRHENRIGNLAKIQRLHEQEFKTQIEMLGDVEKMEKEEMKIRKQLLQEELRR